MDLLARQIAREAKTLVAGATSDSRFYPTLAAATADSALAVGQTYVSTDDDALGPHSGIKWIYTKTATAPYWLAVRAWARGSDLGSGYTDDPVALPLSTEAQEALDLKADADAVAAALAKRMETYVSDIEPATAGAALWFKTSPGSLVATLWVQEA